VRAEKIIHQFMQSFHPQTTARKATIVSLSHLRISFSRLDYSSPTIPFTATTTTVLLYNQLIIKTSFKLIFLSFHPSIHLQSGAEVLLDVVAAPT
jgi:hypothetical protein